MSRAAIILAAGMGTRMRSALPKVMHKVGGQMMFDWSLALAKGLRCDVTVPVVGTHSSELLDLAKSRVGEGRFAIQDPPQGTGHAVQCAMPLLEDFHGNVIVLYADTPLLPAGVVEQAFERLEQGAAVCVLGFNAKQPGGYGRLVVEHGTRLLEIVEAKEATKEQLAITLCNSGVMAINADIARELLPKLTNENAKKEYYLTDLVALARQAGHSAQVVLCDEEDVLGVNSRTQLAQAEHTFQRKRRQDLMLSGVTMIDPESVFVSHDTVIEEDVTLEPSVFIGPGVAIKSGATIKAFSHIEGSAIGERSAIGPFARLRPKTALGPDTKIGNFVETKNTNMANGAKVNHLSYVGDGEIGEKANIGAGTIFCNYDGFFKHTTTIGEGAFVGSNSSLVAPVTIGAGAYVGSGSVITKSVEPGALSVARSRQSDYEGWAITYRARMQERKDKT